MLSKVQYKFVFDNLMDTLFKNSAKPAIEIKFQGIETWYVFDYFAFSEIGDEQVFNEAQFRKVECLKYTLKDFRASEQLKDTGITMQVNKNGKKLSLHKFMTQEGVAKWINSTAEKVLPTTEYEYRSTDKANAIYCVKGGVLRGIIMAYKVKEDNENEVDNITN